MSFKLIVASMIKCYPWGNYQVTTETRYVYVLVESKTRWVAFQNTTTMGFSVCSVLFLPSLSLNED